MATNPRQLGSLISQSSLKGRGLFQRRKTQVSEYENGFVITEPNRENVFHFSELAKFKFGKLSLYMNGSGQGLTYYLMLWREGRVDRPVKFQLFLRGVWKAGETFFGCQRVLGIPARFIPLNGNLVNPSHNETLESIRVRLTEIIASRMIRQFDYGESIEWTPNIFVSPRGITLREPHGPSKQAGFNEIVDFRLKDEGLKISTSRNDWRCILIKRADANFYPGLSLFGYAIQASRIRSGCQ